MLRKIDAFGKPREDLRTRSELGGIITLVASTAAGLLFLAQIYVYVTGVTKHSLHLSLSESRPVPRLDLKKTPFGKIGTLPLKFRVTFPYLACSKLDVHHDNASFVNGDLTKLHGSRAVKLRMPTHNEMTLALPPSEVSKAAPAKACTVEGQFQIHKVGGTFSVGFSRKAWGEVTKRLLMGMFGGRPKNNEEDNGNNVSHYIHYITFGEPFPLMNNPLKDVKHSIKNSSGGLGLENLVVKLVPTRYRNFLTDSDMYQMSVTSHLVQPETLAQAGSNFLPGLALTYDFNALQVHHTEYRDNPIVFLSSLISIVGGVFVTVSLLTGCLVHSAAAVAKKLD
mmetsp:Transcript_5832/g.8296  ORF Transcript_5832/g.8296 Transcript_5832/m.8296 type:complete len:338 (-) Transcript_5832:98-1111(-)|eukprot:CAMPEP_0194043258 /NCGR_PEP_ID=MMETSP0009_2-20130614/14924_1 /TAXON_ID=210454 /ORGANISM="Grammatophora oceanica, Strain CCMP 410" /LENGTH=337 /DNA_ID=CAMNT_0038687403 /DNA_START=21 /DNA_END=1034 /DNA_ORIENTATION=+